MNKHQENSHMGWQKRVAESVKAQLGAKRPFKDRFPASSAPLSCRAQAKPGCPASPLGIRHPAKILSSGLKEGAVSTATLLNLVMKSLSNGPEQRRCHAASEIFEPIRTAHLLKCGKSMSGPLKNGLLANMYFIDIERWTPV
jgi:hypothetical protein